jgi:acyl carrier protein
MSLWIGFFPSFTARMALSMLTDVLEHNARTLRVPPTARAAQGGQPPQAWDILVANMTREEFLRELDDILELASGTLNGAEKLEELEQWNSMAMISFIALADNNGTTVSPRLIAKCATINDLLELAQVNGS